MDSRVTLNVSHQLAARVSIGSLFGFLAQATNVLQKILLVPLFLKIWGNQLYGEWLALYAGVAYLALLDFGMDIYVLNKLNQFYSVRDLKGYIKVFQSAFFLYACFVTIGCLIALSVFFLPIERWLNFQHTSHLTAATATFFLAIQLVFGVPCRLISGLYRTFQENPRAILVGNVRMILTFALMALILLCGGGLIEVAVVQLIPLALLSGFVIYDIKKRHPEIQFGLKESNWRIAISFVGPSSLFFLLVIASVLTMQGPILMVSICIGSGYVAVFAVHRTLINFVRQILESINGALLPELTTLEARQEYATLRLVHRFIMKVFVAICVILAVWLHFVGADIIRFWTLNKIAFHQTLFDVFLVYLIVQMIWQTSGQFLVAFNKHKNPCLCSMASAVLGVGLSFFLAKPFGMLGVVWGILLGDLLICFWAVPLGTCLSIGEDFAQFGLELLRKNIPFVLVLFILAEFLLKLEMSPLLRICLLGILISTAGAGMSYFFVLDKAERKKLGNFINIILHKETPCCAQ